MDLQDDLDAFEDYDDRPHDVPEVADPRDVVEVQKLLRRRASILAKVNEVRQLAAAEHARVDAWADDRTAGSLRYVQRLEQSVEAWMRHVDRSSLPTRWGTPTLTAQRSRVVVYDEAALLAWVKAHGLDGLVTVTETVTKTAVTTVAKPTGVDVGVPTLVSAGLNPAETVGQRFCLDGVGSEIVPGVLTVRPRDKAFGIGPAKPVTPPDEDVPVTPTQGDDHD